MLTTILITWLLAFSLTWYLTRHGGIATLARALNPSNRKVYTSNKAVKDRLRAAGNSRLLTLVSCDYCKVTHATFYLTLPVAWYAGLTLDQALLSLVVATVGAGVLYELLMDDRPTEVTPPKPPKPGKTSIMQPSPLSNSPQPMTREQRMGDYLSLLKSRGYDVEKSDDGKIMVRHVPLREQFWLGFFGHKPDENVKGLTDLYEKAKDEWKDENCADCEKTKVLESYREQALELIDDHIKGNDLKEGTTQPAPVAATKAPAKNPNAPTPHAKESRPERPRRA